MRILAVPPLLLALSLAPSTGQLTPGTLSAFDRYVTLTEQRMRSELSGATPFLWIDRQPASTRAQLLADLKAGRVISERLTLHDNGREVVPEAGILHHWVGTVLIPGTSLEQTKSFVQDYNRYAEHFAPMIQHSKLLSKNGDRFVVSLRTMTKKVITVVVEGDYIIDYRMLGPTKMTTKSVTTNIHEIDGETRHPVDQRDAFMWRLHNYCSFEQRAEGVYEQCESISLSRQIPWVVRPIVRPFVTGVPRETLELTLGTVRAKLAR